MIRPPTPYLAAATVAAPLVLIAALVLTYLISPSFYLRYVLEANLREYQAVEIATFILLMFGGLVLIPPTWRLWKRRAQPGGYLTLAVVGSVMLACFFVAGEEIDWGNTYGLWGDERRQSEGPAMNLHNSELPIKALGSKYLIAIFFVLPGLWAIRRWIKLRLPASLALAVPRWPVVTAMAIAYTWRLIKNLYIAAVDGKDNLGAYGDGGVYWDFIEQINEQKELLIALALLSYGLWCLRYTAAGTRDAPGGISDASRRS